MLTFFFKTVLFSTEPLEFIRDPNTVYKLKIILIYFIDTVTSTSLYLYAKYYLLRHILPIIFLKKQQ